MLYEDKKYEKMLRFISEYSISTTQLKSLILETIYHLVNNWLYCQSCRKTRDLIEWCDYFNCLFIDLSDHLSIEVNLFQRNRL